jgi:hypothetical protein
MDQGPKRDVELLLNELLPFAKQMLERYGEFHPFGGFLSTGGSVVHAGIDPTRSEHPDATDLIDSMTEDFRRRAERGEIVATGIVADVRVPSPSEPEVMDAIQLRLEHRDAYAAEVFVPYRIEVGRSPTYLELFAQKGRRVVFV